MPITNVTTAGTKVPLSRFPLLVARVTIERRSTNTGKVYIGFPGGLNVEGSVSSTVYDCYLDASNPSVTLGLGQTNGNTVQIQAIYLDVDTGGEGVAFFTEQI